MVHTAELTYFPNAQLIKAFQKLKDSVYYSQDHIWYNGSLKDQGLKFRMRIIDNGGFISPRLSCRINFSKVLHPQDKITLITAWDVQAVEDRFNELVKELLPQLPPFKYWWVNRIDYCVNVHTPYVEDYINLMKKGDRHFMQDWYDRNRNYTQKPGSLYLVSTARRKRNRGVTVNFYNKLDEMMKSFEGSGELPNDDELEELPEDILRLEVQCHKTKTEHIRKKYGMEKKTVPYFLAPEIAYEIISTYLKRIAGTADYHRKSVALKMIDATGCRRETKEKLKRIIEDVAKQHSSVAKVRATYEKNGTMKKDEFNRLINTLQSHNINPVTIGNKIHLKDKRLKDGLESVFSIFENAFEEEMTKEG